MLGARTVAVFALYILEAFDVRDIAAAGLVVAGHMAAHAVEVEVLMLGFERCVSVAVGRALPHFERFAVASSAHLYAHIARLTGRRFGRQNTRELLGVGIIGAPIHLSHQAEHIRVAAGTFTHIKRASSHAERAATP